MRHNLKMRQWVPYPVEAVFDFFANPANLPPLMPQWQRARIEEAELTRPLPFSVQRKAAAGHAAGKGSRIVLSFRPVPWVPLRLPWDARIDAFQWDDHFCDRQASGPFGYWLHCHRVEPVTRRDVQGTQVTDDVTYAFPLGPLGELAYWLGGALQVRALFAFRQKQVAKLLRARYGPAPAA